MSLRLPRSSALAPTRHELGPFYSLFNDTFHELQRLSDNLPGSTHFPTKFDVKETKDAYILEGELPGIDQKNVTIEFNDDKTLVIQGHTEHTHEDGQPPAQPRKATVEDEPETKEGASQTVAQSGSTSSGEVAKKQGAQPQATYWVSERSVGSFQRSFTFPQAVSHEAKATLKHGILTVTVPKIQKPTTPRRVQIE